MNLRLLKKALLRLGFWAAIGILLLYAVFPFYYAVLTSLKPSSACSRTRSSSAWKPSCCPKVEVPRSNASVPMATRQPPLTSPTTLACGTRAFSKMSSAF